MSLSLISCEESSDVANAEKETRVQAKGVKSLFDIVTIKNTVKEVPYRFFNVYGVDEIVVDSKINSFEYTLNSSDEIYYSYMSTPVNLNKKKFVLLEDRIFIDSNPKNAIQFDNNEFFLHQDGKILNLAKLRNQDFAKLKPESALLIEFFSDITTTLSEGKKHFRPCQGSQIRTESAFDATQTGASAALEYSIEKSINNNGDLDGC